MGKVVFLLISGGRMAIVLQFEKEVLCQMSLFVNIPVYIPGCLCTDPTGNDSGASPLFYISYKTVAVIAFVRKYDLCHSGQRAPAVPAPYRYHFDFLWRVKSVTDSLVHPLPNGPSLSSLTEFATFPRDNDIFCHLCINAT